MKYNVILKKEKFPNIEDAERIVFKSITKDKINSKAYQARLKELGLSIDDIDIVYDFSALDKEIENHIHNHYPQTKQNSDLADKLYYENILKANGFKNLEQVIVSKVVEFYENNKSIDELLSDVDDANKEAISQLLKVGIRVTWVQRCKEEFKKSIAEDREPSYPPFPKI